MGNTCYRSVPEFAGSTSSISPNVPACSAHREPFFIISKTARNRTTISVREEHFARIDRKATRPPPLFKVDEISSAFSSREKVSRSMATSSSSTAWRESAACTAPTRLSRVTPSSPEEVSQP